MADYDPYAAAATNPYMTMPKPDPWQFLGNALLGVGAGISQADSSGRGIGAGIGPGLMMGANMNAHQQQQAMQYQMMAGYRQAQEEKLRAETEQRREELAMDREAMSYLRGGMSGGPQAAGQPTGLNYQPPAVQMGLNQFNVGNVRPVGSSTGFQQPASFDDGVAMSVRNVRAYPTAYNNGQPMTLLQIGERWAPKGDGANDPAQWAKNVASIGGLPVDQPLDMNDPQIAAKFARGAHGAEWGQSMLKPPEAYVPGASMAGSPRVIKVAGPSAGGTGGNPQIAANGPPGNVQPPRVDPMQYAPLLMSKRLAPYGKGMIDIGNTETQRYLADQERTQKQAQFEQEQRLRDAADKRAGFNAKVGDNGQPNKALIDAETEAERRKRELEHVPAFDRTSGQVVYVPKTSLGSGQYIPLEAQKHVLEAANAKVGPDMQPNKSLIDAETQAAAAKAEAEAKIKLENEAGLELSKAEIARYSKEVRPGVEATMNSLPNLYQMKRLTEGPLSSGSYIEARQAGARILDTLGLQPMSDGMINRTEFNNRAGKQVLAILQTKALGSGTGVSSTDREFVEKMAAQGNYTTEEVKRLTDIAIGSAHTGIKQHNEDIVPRLQKLSGVGKIDKGYFDIAAPTYDQWARENAPAGTKTQQMGSTYTPQLDPATIMQNIAKPTDKAAYDALPAGSPYLHPDGTFKMKPKAVKR